MIKQISPSSIPYDSLVIDLCRTPYYKHPGGCPNSNEGEKCPKSKLIDEVFDFDKELYLIFTKFPVGEFAEKMRLEHSDWKKSTYPDNPKKSERFVSSIINKLNEKHPSWPQEYFPSQNTEEWESCREWYNPRRWQQQARKEHKEEIEKLLNRKPGLEIEKCPEARGVNLTGLMYEEGEKLNWKWPPVHDINNETYLISLAGFGFYS